MSTIVMMGSGNMASNLASAMHRAEHRIVQVYSKTYPHAQHLANKLGCQAVQSIEDIVNDADFYILAVSDSHIEALARQLFHIGQGIVLHTSGSTSIDALASRVRYGVLYPLQTFSKAHIISDFGHIPLLIEACTQLVEDKIHRLACSLSEKVETKTSAQRANLHLAAVFSCNFVNHLLVEAFDLLQKHDISINYLRPLVEETIRKAFETGTPAAIQTGPAIRKDRATLDKHLALLANDPPKKQLYVTLTKLIMASASCGDDLQEMN